MKKRIVKLFLEIFEEPHIQKHLKQLKKYHKETYEHSLRVAVLCLFLGVKNKLSQKEIKLLASAGFLHDIGKTKISKKILNKASKLNQKEREIIESHPEQGFEILSKREFQEIKYLVVAHHRYCPCPYPGCMSRRIKKSKKKDNLIQILAACDLYDALASERVYKPSMTCKQIEDIMEKEFKGKSKYINQLIKECVDKNEKR